MVRFGSRGSRVRITPPRALFVLFDVDEFEALDLRRPAEGKGRRRRRLWLQTPSSGAHGSRRARFLVATNETSQLAGQEHTGGLGVESSNLSAPTNCSNKYKYLQSRRSGIGRLELGISQLSGCQNMPAAGSGWNENAAPRGQTGEQLRVTRKGFNWAVPQPAWELRGQ